MNRQVNLEWLRANVPCLQACPVHTHAGLYVALLAEGRYEEAYRVAAEPNPLASICGHICAAPCERVCRRGEIDQPIAIRALKRFLSERHGVYSKPGRRKMVARSRALRKRDPAQPQVAVVGAGPAGLTVAFELRRLGYNVTIFEASPVAGGMLSLGIPEYRLPRYIIQSQVEDILSYGVELRTNQRLGRDFSLADLRRQGYRAIFLGIGASKGRDLPIEGADLDGVLNGLNFLLNANLNYRVELGQKIIVVGGGNVAVDVARSVVRFDQETPEELTPAGYLREALDSARQAVRMGAREVEMICLESPAEMPAFRDEIGGAEEEGIRIRNRLGPKRILGENGRAAGLETLDVERVFDEMGRFNPTFRPNTERQFPADTIILAIGQQPDLSFLNGEDQKLETTRGGLLAVDPATLETSVEGVFAGGDVAFGPRNVIAAVADGQKAARSIHRYLTGRELQEPEQVEIDIYARGAYLRPDDYEVIPRQPIPVLPADRRIGIAEVELAYEEEVARREARRCLECWVNTIFEGQQEEGSECILCGGCVDICPEECLELVSLGRLRAEPGLWRELEQEYGPLREPDGSPTPAAVMIKDERRCIRCALCALRCPVDCITMESFSLGRRI